MEIYDWNYSSSVTSTDLIVMRQVLHLIKRLLLTCMVMDPSTINTTNFTLKQGTTAITVVTYSGTTASFKPTNSRR
jgi:hypothetical protein